MLRAIWTILMKDLRLRLRDRSVFVFAIVVPLGLTFLFSVILPTEEDLTIRGAVVDDDGGQASAAFSTEVLPSLVESGLVTLDPDVTDLPSATRALEDGELEAVWHFPDGFSDGLESGAGADLQVHVNPDRTLHAEIARGIASAYAGQLDRVVLALGTTTAVAGSEPDAQDLQGIIQTVAATEELLAVVPLVTEGRQLDSSSYLAAGMAAFFVFFVVQFGVTGLLEERQLGTLPRLLAAPIHPGAVQLGKASGAFVLGIVSMAVLATASVLFLGADWGPVPGVAILIVALVTSAMGLMAFVGSFAKTAEQAGNLQAIVAVVLGMLGGVFFPLDLGDGILSYLTLVAPHRWFLRGLGDQVGTGDWWAVFPAAGAIVLFGLVMGGLAVARLRKATRW